MPNLRSRFREVARHWREHFLECNDAECNRARRAWTRISDGAQSVRVHSLRYCFPVCFERELQRRFKNALVAADNKVRPSHRVPLGLLMLARGDLGHAQLRQVLDTQRQRGNGRIGEWIQKLGYAHEQQVTAALALQWSCPLLKVLPERAAECAVPLHLLKHFRMVPVHFARTSRILHLAFGGDIEYLALHAIEQMLGCKTEACLTISAALDAWLAQMDQETNPTDKVFNGKRGPEEMARITSSYALKLHADQVRTVVCGEFIWVRIEGSQDSANLLFLRKQTEVNSSSQKEILGRAAG